jgi:hypothetical protein
MPRRSEQCKRGQFAGGQECLGRFALAQNSSRDDEFSSRKPHAKVTDCGRSIV